ncbi:MAG: DUF86 domain-containing protein [Candidatus Binatia bacterium]
MSRDPQYFLDIVEAAKLAQSYLAGKTQEEFLQDTLCQDAVIRRLEIIGEAARRLSPEARASLPELTWHAMIGMRNLLIHEYDDVDLSIVWDTVKTALPALVNAIAPLVPVNE